MVASPQSTLMLDLVASKVSELLSQGFSADSMDALGCETCRILPDFAAANLREGEILPAGVADLVDAILLPRVSGHEQGVRDYKEVPQCGQLFTYHYYYEFSVGYVKKGVD